MPVDTFLPNLSVFCVGQAAAWFHMRTGRWCAGVLLSGVLWLLADWAIVAKAVFDVSGSQLWLPLVSMQVLAIGAAAWLGVRLWLRRWSAAARRRPELFAAGLAAYLRGDHAEAENVFRKLVRTDPWDAAAWIAAGNVALRQGRTSRARRCHWRGLGVDRRKEFADFVAHQRSRAVASDAKGTEPRADEGQHVALGSTSPGTS